MIMASSQALYFNVSWQIGIPQGLPVSPILFLIYISGVFDSASEACHLVTSLSFVDDLGFIAAGFSVK